MSLPLRPSSLSLSGFTSVLRSPYAAKVLKELYEKDKASRQELRLSKSPYMPPVHAFRQRVRVEGRAEVTAHPQDHH